MKKNEVIAALKAGKTIQSLFPLVDGQECLIFKAETFADTDDVIYIPDLGNSGIYVDEPVLPDRLDGLSLYTGEDFIMECNGNRRLAEDLFEYVDWEGPSAALHCDYRQFSDDEMIGICGQTYNELFG